MPNPASAALSIWSIMLTANCGLQSALRPPPHDGFALCVTGCMLRAGVSRVMAQLVIKLRQIPFPS